MRNRERLSCHSDTVSRLLSLLETDAGGSIGGPTVTRVTPSSHDGWVYLVTRFRWIRYQPRRRCAPLA